MYFTQYLLPCSLARWSHWILFSSTFTFLTAYLNNYVLSVLLHRAIFAFLWHLCYKTNIEYKTLCYLKCFCFCFRRTMPLSTQSQPDEQNVFVASLDNARNLSNILKAIAFKEHAIFSATPNGLKVTVEDSKCLQANAFIQVCFCDISCSMCKITV